MPIFIPMSGRKFYSGVFKPVTDRSMAVVLLILLMPLFLFMAALLSIYFGGQPFFFQRRIGYGGKPFLLIKFRSMRSGGDLGSISRLGRIIRRTSLDEIPQILNIIYGDMSFVGPRPLLPEYLSYFSAAEKMRHAVQPGLTGLAQINGRAGLSWDKRMKLDLDYVERLSFRLDLIILVRTVAVVLNGKLTEKDVGSFIDYAKKR